MSKTIGILGCGWLGLPLAKSFVDNGFNVHGSTTSEEKCEILNGADIKPFLLSLGEDKIEGEIKDFLKNLDVLVINVPPKLRGANRENYVQKMELLCDAILVSKTRNILFVSSTSVYGNAQGEVTEETFPEPNTESGRQLLVSEKLFRNHPDLQTTVIRFCGLIGPNRHPVTMLSGKEGLYNGNAFINLIHLDDCIGVIKSVVRGNWWNEIFNAVYPYHPKKKEYYTLEAQKRGLQPPLFQENDKGAGKKIISSKLILVKNYRFTTSIVN